MPTIVEFVDDDTPMICPVCRMGFHDMHEPPLDTGYEGPTPEPGACSGWDRQSNSLCECPWRKEPTRIH